MAKYTNSKIKIAMKMCFKVLSAPSYCYIVQNFELCSYKTDFSYETLINIYFYRYLPLFTLPIPDVSVSITNSYCILQNIYHY